MQPGYHGAMIATRASSWIVFLLLAGTSSSQGESARPGTSWATLRFTSGDFSGWLVEGENTWSIEENPSLFCAPGEPKRFVVDSQRRGETNTGRLRSSPFRIEHERQRFSISGWDGTRGANNDGERNFVLLRSQPDGEVLRSAHVPGRNLLVPVEWHTMDLFGREVFVEVVDDNTAVRNGGFAWIAFADFAPRTRGTGPASSKRWRRRCTPTRTISRTRSSCSSSRSR